MIGKAGGSGDVRARQMAGAASGVWRKIQEIFKPSAMTRDLSAAKVERVPVILNQSFGVMAGLVPAIHVFLAEGAQERRSTRMKARYARLLAVFASFGLCAAVVQGVHAQSTPPVYENP